MIGLLKELEKSGLRMDVRKTSVFFFKEDDNRKNNLMSYERCGRGKWVASLSIIWEFQISLSPCLKGLKEN